MNMRQVLLEEENEWSVEIVDLTTCAFMRKEHFSWGPELI